MRAIEALTRPSAGDGTAGSAGKGGGRSEDAGRIAQVALAYQSGNETALQNLGKIAERLAADRRVAELLELHAGLEAFPQLKPAQAVAMIQVEWSVAYAHRSVSDGVAEVIDRRVGQFLRVAGSAAPMGYLVRGLVRLRQRRYEEVEQLSGLVQASARSPDDWLAMAAGMLYVARQERGLPCSDVAEIAADRGLDAEDWVVKVRRALDRDQVVADVREFEAYGMRGPTSPSRTDRLLAAYRHGDLVAIGHAGYIGAMLRAEGRVAEMLELHASFAIPPGPHARLRANAMAGLSYCVALLPGIPADVLGEADRRVQWVLDNVEHEPGSQLAANQHTLAVIRLRQGRLSEVEALCADGLANRQLPAENRATVLATIALARRALGRPHKALLAQAVALDPDADLVAEASGRDPQRAEQGT
jgi:hypothetical protein